MTDSCENSAGRRRVVFTVEMFIILTAVIGEARIADQRSDLRSAVIVDKIVVRGIDFL
jgi:hypothetical protein